MSAEVGKRPAYESPGDLARPEPHDPGMRRPAAIIVGALMLLLRVVAGAAWLWELSHESREYLQVELDPGAFEDIDTASGIEVVVWVIVLIGVVVLLVQATLALLVYLGVNWARVLILLVGTLSISGTFVAWWVGDQQIRIDATLATLALDILVMLALSSEPARAYARRRDRSG